MFFYIFNFVTETLIKYLSMKVSSDESGIKGSKKQRGKLSGKASVNAEALRESELRFRMLADAMPQLVWTANPDGTVDYYNERRNEFDGFSQDRNGNWVWAPVLHPDDAEPTVQAWNNAVTSGRVYQIEHRIKSFDGTFHWYLSRGVPVRDDSGKVIKWYGTATDIDDAKKTEQALRISEERYRSLFDNMTEGFAVHEIITNEQGEAVDYIFLDINHAFEQLTGLKRSELLGKRVRDVMPNTESYWIENYGKVALTGEPSHFEDYSAVLGRWYEVFAYRTAPKQFAVIFTDITVRKETEKALTSSRRKLELTLENANVGLWEWDLKTDSISWDARTEKMFGVTPGSFPGTYDAFLKLIHDEDVDHIRKAVRNTIKNNKPYETIFRIKAPDGNMKYISSKALINKDRNGEILNLTGVNFDITDLKQGTELLILKLNEDLLKSNKELESFAYITSHDLQEPLRMVTSFSQLLEKQYGDKLDDRAREYIGFAVDGAKRMYDLINGLLTYSRISRKEITFTNVDFNKVLDSVKDNLSLILKERKCEIGSTKLPVVFADHSQMIHLLQNLISNGIKFSGDSPRIHISAKTEKTHYVFSVRDKGIGIDPQYFDKIFMIFKRLLPRDQYEGTGIGLAICKSIVENHGGQIWVESEPGKGSCFYFTIAKKQYGV
jgi:PAS domain S-box-containing protein